MKIKLSVVLLILLTSALLIDYCFSADINISEGLSVPILPSAKDLWGGSQIVEINGIPTKTLCFSSDTPLSQILDFYKTELPKYGWQLGMRWEGLYAEYFTKADNFLYVAGSGTIRGYDLAMTKFVVVLSKRELHLCATINLLLGPNFKEMDGKDLSFIPRYPGSVRALSIVREDKEAFFVYAAREDAYKIADFYRKNLASSGWRISKKFSVPRSCIQTSFSATALLFERDNKDSLSIYISYCTQSQANIIIISYNYAFNYAVWPIGVDQTW